MKHPVISVNNMSKSFRAWSNVPSKEFKSILIKLLKLKNPFAEKPSQVFVLKNIDLKIYPGEFVGIMGRNGIGKSTILKLISGIYECTSGSIETKGTIAPLLELGAGFELDLTGYENIFFNGAIIGYSKKEILRCIDDIISFSELGNKIDMPVRNYSSGMLMRLGFSIAAHLNSQVILLDEVLGVGDVSFVNKCISKIHDLHKQGRTVVLVTHSPDQVKQHCSRCIVFDKQKLIFDGDPEKGAEVYLSSMLL